MADVTVTVSVRKSRAMNHSERAARNIRTERARGWNNALCNQAAQRSRAANLSSQREAISSVTLAKSTHRD
jgi:hypothetical protein